MSPIPCKKILLTFLITVVSFYARALTASFTASVTSGCQNLAIYFTNTSTGATSYSWDLGNGNTSQQTNASATYPNAGNYTVTLTAKNGSNTATYSVTVTIYPPPVVNFTASPTSICDHSSVTFTDGSTLNSPGGANYAWNFGNGTSGNGGNVTYTYNSPGTYNINLTVTNSAGCTSSLTKTAYITVLPPPSVSFSASPTTLCTTSPTTTFTNSTSGSGTISYEWDFGDGTTSFQTSPTHTYSTTPGSYTVKLYATSSAGCSDTLVLTNYINVVPGTTASFTGPAGVCVGTQAIFVNTSTPGSTGSFWAFGDGNTGSGTSAVHTYNTAGTYHVTLQNTNNACSDTTGHNITIYPAPSVAFTSSPLHPCPAPVTVDFSAPAGAATYAWRFGDGGTSGLQNPPHTYNSNGVYTVTLVATSANGCVDSVTIPNYENLYSLGLNITADVKGGCIPFPVHFSEFAYATDPSTGNPFAYPYPTATYSWNFGDGGTANTDTATHIYQTFGTYTVTLTITTSNGCTITQTAVINAGTPVTPAFSASPLIACVKVPISFTNTTPVNSTTTFHWYFGDGSSSTSYSTSHYYTIPFTSYDVMLVATNNGCSDTLTKPSYITVNAPNARFTASYSCNSRNVSFTNQSVGVTSFLWDFGDGNFDSVNVSPTHIYTANATYHVVLTTHNSTSGCSDSSNLVLIISSPLAVISVTDTALCRDDTVTLVGSLASAPVGGARSYSWFLDNRIFADTTATFKYDFHTTGIKPVMLVVNDYRNCNDTIYQNLLIAHPSVQFSGLPIPVCSPDPVLFKDQSTDAPGAIISGRLWDLGDGNVLSSSTPVIGHGYNAAGSYTVKLYVTDNIGCSDSLVLPAYAVVHKPHADFNVNSTTACMDRAITFNNTSTGTGLTYSWSFGDGGTATTQNAVHSYAQTGTYSVTLVITDNIGCKDSITKANYVNVVADPVAAFTATDTFSICSPLIDTFINQSTGGTSYAWTFGDGNTSTQFNTTDPYTSPGQYNVRLIVTNNNGCTDTATVAVKLLGYAGVLTYSPTSGCAPLTVNFTANVTSVPLLTYDFSDGNTFTTASTTTTHTYTVPGPHVPRVILSNTRCQANSIGLDTIKVDGTIPGFKTIPNPICGADTVRFTDTSKAYFSAIKGQFWSFGKSATSTQPHPTQYYVPGAYTVTLVDTSGSGCIDTSVQTVHVYPLPVISAGTDTTVCVGDSAMLQPSGGVSYLWSPAALLACSACTSPRTAPVTDTIFHVIGTDAHGCTNTDSVRVRLKTKATGTAAAGGDLCLNGSMQLNASDPYVNAQYSWTPPYALSNNTIANPIAKPDSSVRYMVVIKEGKCIPDTAYVDINVHPLPTITVGPGQTILAGSSVALQTSETNVSLYAWSPPDGLSCDSCADPTATPKQSTLYRVFGYSDFGCADSAQVKIDVICDHSQVFLPNTFTPNNDGANDRFYPRGKGLQIIRSFRIYDRWGEKIFEKSNMMLNDISNGWDGTFNGKKLTPDVFVYVVDAICDTGEPLTWTGDITLLR